MSVQQHIDDRSCVYLADLVEPYPLLLFAQQQQHIGKLEVKYQCLAAVVCHGFADVNEVFHTIRFQKLGQPLCVYHTGRVGLTLFE